MTRLAIRIAAIILWGATLGFAQTSAPCSRPAAKTTLAVVDFTVKGDVGIKDAGAMVAELMVSRLNQNQFQLIERSQLEAVLKEIDLTMALVKENPEKAFGKLKGVEYLVLGSVSRLGELTIAARLVDVATGKIIQAADVSTLDPSVLKDAVEELATVLPLADQERIKYREETLYPLLIKNAQARLQMQQYDAAIALYARAMTIRPSRDIRDLLKAAQDAKAQAEKNPPAGKTVAKNELAADAVSGKWRFTNGTKSNPPHTWIWELLPNGVIVTKAEWKGGENEKGTWTLSGSKVKISWEKKGRWAEFDATNGEETEWTGLRGTVTKLAGTKTGK